MNFLEFGTFRRRKISKDKLDTIDKNETGTMDDEKIALHVRMQDEQV